MGCDFFYSGILPDSGLQEKVIEFVQSYYSEIDLVVHPQPELKYKTIIWQENGRDQRKPEETAYPFNFYGVIPACKYGILEHGQFIFDRAWGGRLIRFSKLPGIFNVQPKDPYYNELNVDVYINRGGYNRMVNGSGAFALLLNIIRLRWWPDLWFGDDYEYCKDIGHMIWKYSLLTEMKNEDLDFEKCSELFDEGYKKRHPSRPSLPPAPPKPKLRMVDKNILREPITNLELSIRSSNSLARAEIKTIGHLLKYSEKDLTKKRILSRKSINEIRDILENLGLYLRNTS